MAENGYGPGPVAGHVGRIPNYGKTHVNPMGNIEPPACIQNAMMTKDKKPFTYTPGGLDLSQIKTPSMARRMARQRSLEEHEQAQAPQPNGGNYHPQGGPAPPPPPPPIPQPPPPPALVINVPKSKSPNPVVTGERPEIVIPENPIGMLRKTNSPYHWEAEKAEIDKLGSVPKFVEKVPSPLTVKMPQQFSQHPPQSYTPQGSNNYQRQNQYGTPNNQMPDSPIHRPEAQYAHQKSASPNVNSPQTRETLVRQDSQFNKSPQPYAGQSPISNGSTFAPSPNNNWRQPERKDSPAYSINNSPQSPPFNRGPISPNNNQQYSQNYQNQYVPPPNTEPSYHTLPRVGQRFQDNNPQNNYNNNVIYNNTHPQSPKLDSSNPTPWRNNTLNKQTREPEPVQNIYHNHQSINQQPTYTPPWKHNENNLNDQPGNNTLSWKQDNRGVGNNQTQQQQYTPPWVRQTQDSNNNRIQDSNNNVWRSQDITNNVKAPVSPPKQEPPRYQSTMSIPVTPRKPNTQQEFNEPQKEAVYVNQEPVYYCPDSPKSIPPWVKAQKEKTKTPPPVWVQRPLEGRRSVPRELATPPRETNQEPEWVRKSNEKQSNVREVISPPKFQQTQPQPTWSTKPSDNRNIPTAQGNRTIPVQMEPNDQRDRNQPQLRLVIDMHSPNSQSISQPTQRIMRVLSPQLVRLDDGLSQPDLPSLNKNFQESQPRTRIIPIQIEGDSNGPNKSFGGRY